MSQEAKQAAEQLESEWDMAKMEEVIQQAIDAATAKLREENERLKQNTYMWLGQWRGKLPPAAVNDLQGVLGPL